MRRSRLIVDNVEYIKDIFMDICDHELTDDNFCQNAGDLFISVRMNGKSWSIFYDEFMDQYILKDLNSSSNGSFKFRNHVQRTFENLSSMCSFLKTCHRDYSKSIKKEKNSVWERIKTEKTNYIKFE